jgi:hypothetical protein
LDGGHGQDLGAGGSVGRVFLEQEFHEVAEFFGVAVREGWEHALLYLFIQLIHVCGSKRWIICTHLIQHTPDAPDITFNVIRLVIPHLR